MQVQVNQLINLVKKELGIAHIYTGDMMKNLQDRIHRWKKK